MDSKAPLWKVILCTLCMVGIAFTWTLELAYGTPYLLSLNISRQLTALVWLAGPISGIIIQPLIGAISDNSTFRLGRRRPYIIMSGAIVLASLLCLAFAQELASLPTDSDSTSIHYWTTVIVVLSFYTLDFSLNAAQAACRALIVDSFCAEQQDTVNALSGNLVNLTNVFGYLMGFTDLAQHLPSFFGGGSSSSQFKALCVINIIIFIFTVSVSCIFTNEKRPIQISQASNSQGGKYCFFSQCQGFARSIGNTVIYIWRSVKNLSSPIKHLCLVQFFSWMGWFPFLFYTSTWVAGIYYQEHPDEKDLNNGNLENGTRAGSFALLMYAITAVISGTILPWMTNRRYMSMKTTYTLSLLLLAVTLFCCFWVRTLQAAIAVVGVLGISWSCNIWIPFALIAEYIHLESNSTNDEDEEKKWDTNNSTATVGDGIGLVKLSTTSTTMSEDENENDSRSSTYYLENTGITLGIMNIFISLPQFVVSLFAYVFFAIRQSYLNQSSPSAFGSNDNAINDVTGVAWLFVFGSLMVLISAGLSRRLLDV